MRMKLMVAADLHGSVKNCRRLLELLEQEGAEKLLLLGDLFSHSGLDWLEPEDDVATYLNPYAQRITAVRGNNDWQSDEARIDFPLAEFQLLRWEGLTIFATHGDRYHAQRLPPLPLDILLQGHTHVPAYRPFADYVCLNPGALQRPRGGSKPGYLILEDHTFTWKDLEGAQLMQHRWQAHPEQ